MNERIDEIQTALQEASLDGWLFYDFRGTDPLAYRILGMPAGLIASRRWFYWIPATGEPTKIVHAIEKHNLDHLPGKREVYLPWPQLHDTLRAALKGAKRIAMQFSPLGAVPYIARVDAGTIDLIRSFGVEIVSSGNLVSRFEAVWTPEQWESHQEVSNHLVETIQTAYRELSARIQKGETPLEREIQQLMMEEFGRRGVLADHPPIVARNENAANPHYSPPPEGSAPIARGDLLLIDYWGRMDREGSVCADYTWMATVDDHVHDRHDEIFQIVRAARDAGIARVKEGMAAGETLYGRDVDDAVRAVIDEAGYGHAFLHRTGHSIGREVHGNGANIDNLETDDDRTLLPSTCFSIEPGIYLEGEIGVRSEVDVFISADRDVVVTGQTQTQVVALLAEY